MTLIVCVTVAVNLYALLLLVRIARSGPPSVALSLAIFSNAILTLLTILLGWHYLVGPPAFADIHFGLAMLAAAPGILWLAAFFRGKL